MMVINVQLSIKNFNDELYNKLQEIASKTSKSIKELVEESVRLYVLGVESIDKPLKSVKNGLINVQYQTKCYRCKKDIKVGDVAYWVRYIYEDNTSKSYILCLDCYLTEHDEALAKQYLNLRKIKAQINGLKKLREKLANQITTLEMKVEISNMYRELVSALRILKDAINSSDYKKVDELLVKVDELNARLDEIELALKTGIVKVKKAVKPKV